MILSTNISNSHHLQLFIHFFTTKNNFKSEREIKNGNQLQLNLKRKEKRG